MLKYCTIFFLIFVFALSCGKKEENQFRQTQNIDTAKTQVQKLPENTMTQTEQKQDSAKIKEEKKKKEEAEKKKKEETKKKEEEAKKDETTQIDFGQIFMKRCAKCHGATGKGKIEGAPDFTSTKTQSKSDKQLFNAIKFGIKAETEEGDDMPAWQGKLTDDEIRAAVKYIRQF